MKINEILNPDEEIYSSIMSDCQDILKIYYTSHRCLYRGIKNFKIKWFQNTSPAYRKPVDSNLLASKYIDDTLKYLGIKALRSNSIFTSSSIDTSMTYSGKGKLNFGGEYVIFPVNGFKYCWSRESADMVIEDYEITNLLGIVNGLNLKFNKEHTEFLDNYVPGENDYKKIQNHYQFTDENLVNALKSGHEVWLHTDYYALNVDLCQDIFEQLGLQI